MKPILEDIARSGGEPYLIGGGVIDPLQGREVKDWDIEVHGLSQPELGSILSGHASAPFVGNRFATFKLRLDSVYDFSLPRRETSTGAGHNDFDFEFDPSLSLEEAAYRRDLTINSMAVRLDDSELFDFYGGLKDLEAGMLRHTSEKFVEDPIRVLRIMQLLPRKGRSVHPETIELARSLSPSYPALNRERVEEEWDKLLLKPNNPSAGLQFLVDCGWISHYPELEALQYTPQNPVHHPEGDVWTHTKLVVDAGASFRENLPAEWKRAYMYGLLLHDVGKAVTTQPDYSANGHEQAGVPLALEFLSRFSDNSELRQYVSQIVANHMTPGQLYRQGSDERAWRRLHNRAPLNILGYVAMADSLGRGFDPPVEDPAGKLALDYFTQFGESTKPIPHLVMGRDLIALGYKPGPGIGQMVKQGYELQLDGAERPAILANLTSRYPL